ncbi:MAG: dihydroorotate dehydrogenase (quinone) [Patescibacteria group bacterium]
MYALSGFLYRNVIKRILFLFPADDVHEFFLHTGRRFGRSSFFKSIIRMAWRYDDPILEQIVCGLVFKNPIGLSAGFDYNADLVEILPSIGFGFHTIGTLTHESYEGNTPPMLGRLPRSRSLLVNKGFKNKGITHVLAQMPSGERSALRGVSIGATNKAYPDFNAMVENLVAGFRDAERFKNFDYYELNISCPNLLNLQNLKEQLASSAGLEVALMRLSALQLKRPVFIKMPLERTVDDIKKLVDVAAPHSFISGLIFSNLAKDRSNPAFDRDEVEKAGAGNFSGKPVEKKSNELLRYAYKTYHERFILIGVGGVFTAEDAYQKICFGASLVQLITGMVFMGPQQIGSINKGVAELLRKDNFHNIQEAIGVRV